VPAEKDNETDIREIREEKGGEKKKKNPFFPSFSTTPYYRSTLLP